MLRIVRLGCRGLFLPNIASISSRESVLLHFFREDDGSNSIRTGGVRGAGCFAVVGGDVSGKDRFFDDADFVIVGFVK